MNKRTVGEWGALYEIALDIKALDPWAWLGDEALIRVCDPLSEEDYYFGFMRKSATSRGISCFIGTEGLQGFYDMMNGGDAPSELLLAQKSLIAYFGAQEDLTEEDAALIEALNLFFKGEGDWLWFRSFEPGYTPWPLSREEVVTLTGLYRQLHAALRYLGEAKPKIAFEREEILSRRYDADAGEWVNESVPFVCPPREYEAVTIRDELMLARALKRPLVDARLELDVFGVMVPVEDEAMGKPFYPTMALLADASSGQIIEFEMFTPEDSAAEHVFSLLMGFIEKHGRPLMIYMQSPRVKAIIEPLSGETMLATEMVNFLPAINAFKLEKGITRIPGAFGDDELDE
jgi:hypothetical protein